MPIPTLEEVVKVAPPVAEAKPVSEVGRRFGLCHETEYTQGDVANILKQIHPGYFDEPTVDNVMRRLGSREGVSGTHLIEFVEQVEGLVLISNTWRRSRASLLDTHHTEIDCLLTHPSCVKYVHTFPGISDRPYILERDQDALLESMRTVIKGISEGGGDDAHALEAMLGHYKAVLTQNGVLPPERDYALLQKARVLREDTAESIRRSHDRFIALVEGYDFSIDFHRIQKETGLDDASFYQGPMKQLIERGVAIDVVSTSCVRGTDFHVYAAAKTRKPEVYSFFER